MVHIKYYILLIICVLFISRVFSYNYDINFNFVQFDIPAYLTSDVDNEYLVQEHRMSYMFDGNSNSSFCIINGTDSLSFRIFFNNPIPIDEIRILNGNFNSDDAFNRSYRFLRLGLSIFCLNEFGEISYNFYTNIKLPAKPQPFVLKNFEDTEKTFWGVNFYFDSVNNNNIEVSNLYITDIQFWYKGKRYNILNLNKLEEQLQNVYVSQLEGRFWRKLYQLEPQLQFKQRPIKQWWEFWKSDKEYRKTETPRFLIKFAEWLKYFWNNIEVLIWFILIVLCLIFAIVRRESNTPLWTRIMSIVNPIYILGLILLNFIFSRNLDFLITGIFVMLGLIFV
ncbi:MAG: hypothetical protein ACP5Q5_02255 [Brevinematia bacterium]